MHSLKLFGKRPKEKYHSYKGEVDKTADNIINRNFKADAPYEKIINANLNMYKNDHLRMYTFDY